MSFLLGLFFTWVLGQDPASEPCDDRKTPAADECEDAPAFLGLGNRADSTDISNGF